MAVTRILYTQKVKVKGHSVQKLEWKQTDEQRDGRTDGGDNITCLTKVVGKKLNHSLAIMTASEMNHYLKWKQFF